jgi:hypothetical protein
MKRKLVLLALISLASCENISLGKKVWRISIENRSSQIIQVIHPEYDRKKKEWLNINLYPDTSLVQNKPINMISLKPTTKNVIDLARDYDETFETIPSGKLSIYIFSEDTLNKYSWEEIRQGYKVLKRYDLTHAELDQMDYTIVYQ